MKSYSVRSSRLKVSETGRTASTETELCPGLTQKAKVLVAQLCLTLCDPVDRSPPGSSVHGILQARILEWVAIPFSRGSFRPRDQTQVLLHCRQILHHLSH